ncbi:metalloregulator ArsR/SmtB family transcription factor [Caulobacter sp. SLTY]|uniref:metalloregulator ArsR/SmtB family transcription factor n=1 Tax=Caulobacter sp. SLTY TaxID=2683262 RepID=UPI001411DDDC|nr:metalloregulator ArsR/SmtB family transcription factor [Caulobacter sp. SLTY]NBB17176.1 metalloregulator ArsR/SmtB family transcription factor [Caulobacter sp. SLTY]
MNTLFKALAHPARRQIIEMLRAGPKSSGDIANAFDMAWPTVTGHLTSLREAGLVESERDGASIIYRLNISAVEEALAFLLDIIKAGEAPAATPKGAAK